MTLYDLNPFVRYANEGAVSPLPQTVRAYDCRLFYLLRGKASITVEDQLRVMSPDSLLLIPSGTRYLFEAEADTFMFVFNYDHTCAFSKFSTPLPIIPLQEPYTPPAGMQTPFYTDAEALNRPLFLTGMHSLIPALRHITEELRFRRVGWEAKSSAYLKGILIDCLRLAPAGGSGNDTAERLLAWLRENCCHCPDADEVSRHFGYHPVHLNRIMHRAAGVTLHQYVLQCRLDEAKHLLETTKLSVEEIAFKTGFSYVSNFSGCFSRMTGITPGAYRKAHQGLI